MGEALLLCVHSITAVIHEVTNGLIIILGVIMGISPGSAPQFERCKGIIRSLLVQGRVCVYDVIINCDPP